MRGPAGGASIAESERGGQGQRRQLRPTAERTNLPTENAEPTAAVIPGSKLIIIPDTDHLTVVPDQRFKDEVLTFLE